MELRLLKVFGVVAESSSLVTAARKLHLTPSAISHSLKSLETDLGCRLFERVGKRMVLNHAGEQLFAQIQDPLSALEAAAEGIRHLGKWGQTRLRIAASSAACEHLLPGVIRELKKAHPSLELRVESCDTPRAIELLNENKVDVALGLVPAKAAGLAARPVFRDELMFVFGPDHPWAAARSINREDIRGQQFIICQRSSLTAWLLEDYFRRLQVTPNITMEVASTAAIIELVKSNVGVSILAPWTVSGELLRGELKIRPLASKPLWRNWSIIALASRKLSLAEETFCRLCRNHAAGMRLDRSDLPSGSR